MAKWKNILNNSVTYDDSSLCLCLSLCGTASCRFPSHCETATDHETHFTKKRKLVSQETKNNNICNVAAAAAAAAAVPFPLPIHVARRARNWGFSTGLVLYDDTWRIKKVLTQTDLGSNCNILIKRELAKDLIVPVLGGRRVCENNDVHVRVWDIDTNSLHSLVFTIRPSNNSHVFKDTWVKDFVIRRNLKIGDEIGMLWDQYNQRFVFSVIRAYRHH
ncbi:B3 domain-containing protein [Trifolium repens]|nr:B3 domain-containing protein [Trifolium repens]